MSDSTEMYYAEMEAARSEAEDAYFKARPSLGTEVDHALFRSGFERAFQPLWNKLQRARAVMEVNDPINARDIFGTPTIHGVQLDKEAPASGE